MYVPSIRSVLAVSGSVATMSWSLSSNKRSPEMRSVAYKRIAAFDEFVMLVSIEEILWWQTAEKQTGNMGEVNNKGR